MTEEILVMDDHLYRAHLLIEQGRYKDAEIELGQKLSQSPNDPTIFALLSICKHEQGANQEAKDLIEKAISLAPDQPNYIYLNGKYHLEDGKYDIAEELFKNAILLEANDPDYYMALAAVKIRRRLWQEALDCANIGLNINPSHVGCLNIRSQALVKLDNKEAAYNTIQEALYYDPENSFTHSNVGWGLLEQGDHKKGLEHFKTALKLDPNNEWAKAGLVEALKAKYWIYRMFLRYAFWISNLQSKAQWIILLGFYIGSRILNFLGDKFPAVEPFITPIIIIYTIFAISSWIINPLSNLFLRINKYGRYALDKNQIISSNFVGISLLVSIISFLLWLLNPISAFFSLSIFCFIMMIPYATMFNGKRYKKVNYLLVYTCVLFVVGLISVITSFNTNNSFNLIFISFLVLTFIYQLLANAAAINE